MGKVLCPCYVFTVPWWHADGTGIPSGCSARAVRLCAALLADQNCWFMAGKADVLHVVWNEIMSLKQS